MPMRPSVSKIGKLSFLVTLSLLVAGLAPAGTFALSLDRGAAEPLTVPLAHARDALPNLRALSGDLILDEAGTPALLATFDNMGEVGTGPFRTRFTAVSADGDVLHEATVTMEGLGPREAREWRFPWAALPPYGTVRLGYVLDADNLVVEVRESDNELGATRVADRPLDLPASEYVRIQRADGAFEAATPAEVVLDAALRVAPSGDRDALVLVYLPWLERALGGPAGSARPFDAAREVDGLWASSFAPAGEAATFERADLARGDLFTLGSDETVRVADRPMLIRVLQTPGWVPYEETLHTPNGTVTQTLHRFEDVLAIDFEAPDHSGQDVLLNKAWVSALGVKEPVFAHEDGSLVPHDETRTHYVLHPEHFSTIYSFDASNEGFSQETGGTYSEVSWDSANGRVNVISDRRDGNDEIFRRALPSQLTTTSTFSVTSKWRATTQGNWQAAFPIFLARNDVTSVDGHASTAYIYYYSRDSNVNPPNAPQYVMRYRDAGGVLRINQAYDAQANTEYHFFIGFDAGILTMKVRSATDVDLATATYQTGAVSNDGFTFDKIGIASDGWSGGQEPRIEAWADHVVLDVNSGGGGGTCEVAGPDSGGYTCTTITYGPRDTTGGTTVSLTDDSVSSAISLPFTFTWYGQAKTTAYIGSNGVVCFGSASCNGYNPPAPPSTNAPNDVVACFWEDLNPGAGGFIRYKTVGTAPSRVFVVEYNNVPHYGSTSVNVFQTQLHENGEAHCALATVTNNADGVSTASGTENAAGTAGVRYKYAEFAASSTGVKFATAGSGGGLSENFEGSASGWTYSGFWHVATRRAASPTHSIWYGREDTVNYDNGAANSGSAVSPTFTVPTTSPTLAFQSWYKTEDTGTSWDVKVVEISTDGGANWASVGQVSGTAEQWVGQSYSLSAWAGQSAKLRFRFDTIDASYNNFEGWYVDDVQVTGGTANNPPTACFPAPTVSGRNVTVNGSCSSDPDNDALTYSWAWGDGGTGTGQSASRQYACPGGTYTITLTVSDGRGGQGSTQRSVTTAEPDADTDGLVSCRETAQNTNDAVRDTDGDALSDHVESIWHPSYQTLYCANQICNAPNPLKKDIYVEMDFMGSDHLPTSADLQRIVDVFAASPLAGNPDGSTGIALHLDAGTGHQFTIWDIGGGNSITHDTFLGTAGASCSGYDWTEFQGVKDANFATARHSVYHYMIWAHNLADTCGSTSGMSRGIGASDFIVSLGGWTSHGTADVRVGTFIHELGHNLGLRHGGGNDVNYKSNYLSVMNYFFQTTGVPRTDNTFYFGYSQALLPSLNEASLDENVGLNSADANNWKARWRCGANTRTSAGTGNGPVDWNCGGTTDILPVRADINGDGDCTTPLNCDTHVGFRDWGGIVYDGGLVGPGAPAGAADAGVGEVLPMRTEYVDELTAEEDERLHGGDGHAHDEEGHEH